MEINKKINLFYALSISAFVLYFAYFLSHVWISAHMIADIAYGETIYLKISNFVNLIMAVCFCVIPYTLLSKGSHMRRKAKVIKIIFIIIGACYVIGNLWIFKFIFDTAITGANAKGFMDYQKANGYSFYMINWGNRRFANLFLNFIVAGLYFYLCYCVDAHYDFMGHFLILAALISIVSPIVVAKLCGDKLSPTLFFMDSCLFIGNFLMAMLFYVFRDDYDVWNFVMWCTKNKMELKEEVKDDEAEEAKANAIDARLKYHHSHHNHDHGGHHHHSHHDHGEHHHH